MKIFHPSISSSFQSSKHRAQPQVPNTGSLNRQHYHQQQQHQQHQPQSHHQYIPGNNGSPTPNHYASASLSARYVHTPQPPQDVTYETVSNASSSTTSSSAHNNHNNHNNEMHNHNIIYENLQVVGQRAQPQQPVVHHHHHQHQQHQQQQQSHYAPVQVQPAHLMRATESPLSSSSSPPRPVAPQSYQANVVAPAVATTLKAVAAAASHSPQHSKSGSTSSSTGGGGGGGRLVATVGHHPAGPHQPLSHYQAMRPISVNGAGGDIYQNTGHTAQRSLVGGGGGNIGNASCMQFHPIYGTTAVTAAGHQQQGVTVDDNGTHSDYVCMLAGGASSMDGGGGAGATSSTYQPIFATSASLINDTPVKVKAYKADSVSIQQFPTASTAVAASQPKPPPPAALKKPEQANKPKVNPLAPTSDANLLPPPQRRTPSLPPSSPTPSNLSSGSGSGRGE